MGNATPIVGAVEFDMRHYLTEVAGHYHPGRPGYLHPQAEVHGVLPLWRFPEAKVEEILDACERRTPPPRWLKFIGCRMESRAWYEWHWTRGRKLYADESYAPRSRRKIPDALRLAIYERDGFACLHCGTTEGLSLDHIHPYSLGGDDTFDNLQTLCRPCNSRKGARV